MIHVALQPLTISNSTSLVESVYETILEAILSGRLKSGLVLSEVSLAKDLEVSRTPVHDALRQLAKDGLVEQSKGRRAKVAAFTADDVYEIFELRKCLEGPAAELAARRMDQRQLAPLRAMADDLKATRGTVGWTSRWADFDELFHHLIAEGSGNRRLSQDIKRYRLLHRGYNRRSSADETSLPRTLDEHYRILAALEAHDGATAREAMVEHLNAWQEFYIRTFGQ